jgi:hypothetical protein
MRSIPFSAALDRNAEYGAAIFSSLDAAAMIVRQ